MNDNDITGRSTLSGPPAAITGRRRRRPTSGRVLAAAGPGWALWWPLDRWAVLTDLERRAVAAGQGALLDQVGAPPAGG